MHIVNEIIDEDRAKYIVSEVGKETANVNGVDKGFERYENCNNRVVDDDFYVCVEQNALYIAKEVLKSVSFLKKVECEGDTLFYVTLNKLQFEHVVKELLLVHQYRVELFRLSNETQSWELCCKATPGNVSEFESILGNYSEIEDVNRVVAFKIFVNVGSVSQIKVSLACCELLTHSFRVCEFVDNEHLSNLQCALVQIAPRECITLATTGWISSAVDSVFRLISIPLTIVKQNQFDSSDLRSILDRLLKFKKGSANRCDALPEFNLQDAMQCVAAIVRYLKLMMDDCNMRQFSLETIDLGQFLRLDYGCFESLNLWKLNASDERLHIVGHFVNDKKLRCLIHQNILARFPDIHKISKLLVKKRVGLSEIHKMYSAVVCIPVLLDALSQSDVDSVMEEYFVAPLKILVADFDKFVQMVRATLDFDYLTSTREYRIKPQFDQSLSALHEEIQRLDEKLEKSFDHMSQSLNLEKGKTVKMEWNKQYGYCFRVTIKSQHCLKNQRGIQILDTLKGGIKFTDSRTSHLSEKMTEVKRKYGELQKKTVDTMVEVTAGYLEPFKHFGNLIASLDVLVSFAVAAVNAPIPYVKPNILDKGCGEIDITDGRHPCLELQADVSCIPNSLRLSKGDTEMIVLTGPNMGGKSTYLRQAAVIVIMAQIGSFVPAKKASVSLVDSILTRIGASDNQYKGLSTFMTEMVEAANILKVAKCDSLILIDELGRGTSTFDGLGLSWAIARDIASRVHAFCLFASHFLELTMLADEVDVVKNFYMRATFAGDQLVLLYQVLPGICDRSFGINVARMVNFPEEVLQDARDEEERLESFRLDENGRKILNVFLLLKEKLSTAADSSDGLLPYVCQITKELEKRLSTSAA
ncbi:DNA mismatch repair protein Msh2 [Trichuris trichiura]|uniref:DNA mismatch repair protein Msh2 n=1 Tax=Trichuris trichiura TaxID=36087 RepID=A0A077ZDQ8_TRITR|nr:DNA mismatch repair protein Msh2 [Trichuris trichiura]